MYYMIHATDHPDAPIQMSRAYRDTVLPFEPPEQYRFWPDAKGADVEPGPDPPEEAHQTA